MDMEVQETMIIEMVQIMKGKLENFSLSRGKGDIRGKYFSRNCESSR